MSLYDHFDSKDDLLASMSDYVSGEVLVEPPLPEDWREALAAIARRLYTVMVTHPWLVFTYGRLPRFGPNATKLAKQMAEAVATLPLEEEEVWTMHGHRQRLRARALPARGCRAAARRTSTTRSPRARSQSRRSSPPCRNGFAPARRSSGSSPGCRSSWTESNDGSSPIADPVRAPRGSARPAGVAPAQRSIARAAARRPGTRSGRGRAGSRAGPARGRPRAGPRVPAAASTSAWVARRATRSQPRPGR